MIDPRALVEGNYCLKCGLEFIFQPILDLKPLSAEQKLLWDAQYLMDDNVEIEDDSLGNARSFWSCPIHGIEPLIRLVQSLRIKRRKEKQKLRKEGKKFKQGPQ